MASLPPVPNVARVSVQGTLGGLPYANVFHHRWVTPAQTTADMNAIALGYRNAYKNNLLAKVTPSFVLGSVLVQDLTSQSGPSGIATGSDPGVVSATNYPNNVAMCVSWKIDRHYRGGKPRTYLGGFASGNNADLAHWAGAFITSMTTTMNAILTALNGITLPNAGVNGVGCVHYIKDKNPLAVPTFDNYTALSIDSRIDSQRRRLGRK